MNTRITKAAYIVLVETYVRYGYDISDMLNPTYKWIDAQKCLDVANSLIENHEGEDWWQYENKYTLENITYRLTEQTIES